MEHLERRRVGKHSDGVLSTMLEAWIDDDDRHWTIDLGAREMGWDGEFHRLFFLGNLERTAERILYILVIERASEDRT